MDASNLTAAQHIAFIDDTTIQWSDVRRVQCLFYQHFHYAYPGPIHNLQQRLVVIPAEHYNAQRLSSHHLAVSPEPISTVQTFDRFGNRVLDLAIPVADEVFEFEVVLVVEREVADKHIIQLTPAERQYWLKPTFLTLPNPYIDHIAHQLRQQKSDPHELAQHISNWVHTHMFYKSGVTNVDTAAAEVMAIGQGMCQDYAHLMLCLCRAVGLPARYVSGHMLGEGGSHAWVEVLVPVEEGYQVVAFDPTNKRTPHLNYVTVAIGRDYRDVSPTSGRFTAPYGGQLTFSKRAGITHVEYFNGDIVASPALEQPTLA